MCIFKVHNVSQWLNLTHLAEPLRGAVGLLEAVSFKEATESVCRSRTMDARG